MTWLSNFLSTSVGRKQLMAVTGLGMAGFLVIHLSGNLLLFVGEQTFNDYAAFLHKQKWLPLARIGLIAITVVHIYLAFQLAMQNKTARGTEYYYKAASDATLASRSMIYTGCLIFFYLIIHLMNFTFETVEGPAGLYGLVVTKLSNPTYGLFYVGAMVVLGLHLVHGIQSAFQSFGIGHRGHTPHLKKALIGLAVLISAGFALIPIIMMITKGGA
ncbi:MAG: succinate dehydrogenase cytochrome b subunit [Acidobacteriota bacterium]|nr:succinate dehydrogenase cytochrome b subunit [Acidobacteriota bacterium]